MKSPVITLLTDFGLADHYVGAMKGVILGICPEARLVDISHEVKPYSISEAAYILSQAWDCFPTGTTHVAVVDPGVGSSRRAIVAELGGHRFIAPDNGLLSLLPGFPEKAKVREISAVRYFRQPVSQTFHGRDIFAPVAAHVARGLALAKLGKSVFNPAIGDFAEPVLAGPGKWYGKILKVDHFGNIITNYRCSVFSRLTEKPFFLKIGNRKITRFYPTYAAAPRGRFFALQGSAGYIEVSLNQSNAAISARVSSGADVLLTIPA